MKCSLGISNFLEEISSLSHSTVFFYFFAFPAPITLGRLSYLSLLFFGTLYSDRYIYRFLPFTSVLFSAICKASSDNHFPFFSFLFLGDGLHHSLLYNVTNLCPLFFRHSIRSNPLNLSPLLYNCKGFDLGHTLMA